MREMILAVLAVLVIGGGYAVQQMRVQAACARAERLEKDLAAAAAEALRWQAAVKASAAAAEAQEALASACVRREAQARTEADAIADIMAGAVPTAITPEQARQGVDGATRQRAAAMLNRPL